MLPEAFSWKAHPIFHLLNHFLLCGCRGPISGGSSQINVFPWGGRRSPTWSLPVDFMKSCICCKISCFTLRSLVMDYQATSVTQTDWPIKGLMPWLGLMGWGEMLGIKGGPGGNLASCSGSILVYDNFPFLTQPSNFSDSHNQGSFCRVWIFELNPLPSVFQIFWIQVHRCLNNLANSYKFLLHILSVVWYQGFLSVHCGHNSQRTMRSQGRPRPRFFLLNTRTPFFSYSKKHSGKLAWCRLSSMHTQHFSQGSRASNPVVVSVNVSQPHPQRRGFLREGLVSVSFPNSSSSLHRKVETPTLPLTQGVWLGQRR